MVYSRISFVDNPRNLRFPAPAARFCRVRGYLNLDICCVDGVNSLRRGLRRASSLWEGASGAPGRFLIASKTLAIGLTACALSVTFGDSSPKGRAKSTAGNFLIIPNTLVLNFTAWLPPSGELARERLRGRTIFPHYFAFLHIFTTFWW